MTAPDLEVIRQWLINSRGTWAEISRKSAVSIRTMSNIVSGHYDAPRKMTLRGLESVRRKMAKK